MDEWQPELVTSVWKAIDHGEKYDWPKKPFSVAALQDVLPSLPADIGYASDKAAANRLLRRKLNLRELSREHRCQAALWIIRDWGGIKSGDKAAIPRWLTELGEFGRTEVDAFVGKQKTRRISSWSKLLAFAHPDAYAIYDSWTTIALNYGLAQRQEARRFFMPAGQLYVPRSAQRSLNAGQLRKTAQEKLRHSKGWDCRHYASYMSFLKRAVACGLASDLLEAEMFLFANGPAAAKSVVAAYSV